MKQAIAVALVLTFLGTSVSAQQTVQTIVQKRPTLMDQALAVARHLPAEPRTQPRARAAGAQAAPASSRRFLQSPWFWAIVAGAVAAGLIVVASGDDENGPSTANGGNRQ
jgi:hypothetical protein